MNVRPTFPVLPALDGVVVTAAGIEAFDCPVCGEPRDLEIPWTAEPEADADRPERACAECGFAVVVGSGWREPEAGRLGTRRAG